MATSKLSSDPSVSAYLREMGRGGLLTAQQEREAAEAIVAGRGAYWLALLSYAPHVEAIVDALREAFRADVHRVAAAAAAGPVFDEALDGAAAAALAVDRKETKALLAGAVLRLASVVAGLDHECDIADAVAADIARMALKEPPVLLRLHPPRHGSRPFAEHLAAVNRSAATFRAARNRLVRANLRLVAKIAGEFRGWTLADRIQEGNLGLIKAVCRFDPARGFRFTTYGTWWIRHSIRRGLHTHSRLVRLPCHMHEKISKLEQLRRTLTAEHAREPTDDEIAAAAGIPVATVRTAVRAMMAPLSVDTPLRNPSQGRSRIADALPDPALPAPEKIDAEAREARVMQALERLDERDVDIIRRRFGLDADRQTLAEIGEQHGLSRERIRQLETAALEEIRAIVGSP